MSLLNIENLTASIDGKEIFDNLSYKFDKGKAYFILGPSGSGKTSLLNTILGLKKPDNGEIKYNDIEIYKNTFKKIQRDNIGVVFQESALFSEQTVLENILFSLKVKGIKNNELENRKEEIYDILNKLELFDILKKYPEQLSGGQRRLAAFLRAYIKKPDLIILDEPFTGLDRKIINLLISLLGDLKKNTCIIIISHQYNIAEEIGAEVLFLKKNFLEPINPGEIETKIKKHINKKEKNQIKKKESFKLPTKALAVFFEELGVFVRQLLFMPSYFNFKRVLNRLGGLYLNSIPLICVSLFLIGFSIAYQSGIPLKMYNSIDLLPKIFSKSVYIEIGPLMIGILLSSRIVSGLTSEFGSKKINRIFDYLNISGVNTRSYIISEIYISSLPGLLIIFTFGLLISSWGGALAYKLTYSESLTAFLKISFMETGILKFFLILIKSFLFIVIMISQSYYWGTKTKEGAEDIGKHVKFAVVHSAIGIIIINVLFVKFFTLL